MDRRLSARFLRSARAIEAGLAGEDRLKPAEYSARLLLCLAIGLVPVAWLMARPGWPIDHERLRMFRRMFVTAGQWRLGHVWPVWSTTAFDGFGSASPAIYHKVFTAVSTALFLLTGAPKTAVCLSVVLVLAVAALGVGRACRVMLRRADLAVEAACGVMVAFATYTTTDWVERGAMAELAALAGVAWLFAWCLALLRDGRWSLWIGPLMAAIFLCHSALALFCLLPVAICLACAFLRHWRVWRGWAWRAPASAAIALLLVAPDLVTTLPYTRFSNMAHFLDHYRPRDTHLPFKRLFAAKAWHWGDTIGGLTVQIDPAFLVVAGLLPPALWQLRRWYLEAGFLAGVVATVLVLQTGFALPFYDFVPGAAWIQFSFRLLTFLVVAMALAGALVLAALRDRFGARACWAGVGALVLALSLGKPWLGGAPGVLAYTDSQLADAAFGAAGSSAEAKEYVPAPESANLASVLSGQAAAASGPCAVRPLDDMRQEREAARFAVSCATPAMAILPLALAPGMRFVVAGAPVDAMRTCPDAHARLAVAGDAVVTVRYPGFSQALDAAMAGRRDPALACVPPDGG